MTPISRNRTASVVALGLLVSLLSPSRAFTQAPDAIAPVTFVGPSGDPPSGGGDVNTFPITTAVTRVNLTADPGGGVEVVFDKRDGPNRWPDTAPCLGDPNCNEIRPDGTVIGMGALQYSLGLAMNIPGQGWFASAPIETWFGNNVTGGEIQATGQIPNNWFYDPNRWAPLTGYQPKPGEMIGVFVVAGDARNNFYIVKERSNIVLLPLPAPGVSASFCFDSAGQIIPCPPPPPPAATTSTGGGGTTSTGGGTASSSSSSSGSTTTTSPPPLGPQYTSGGSSLASYATATGSGSGSGSGGGGSGGGGGGCWVGSAAPTAGDSMRLWGVLGMLLLLSARCASARRCQVARSVAK